MRRAGLAAQAALLALLVVPLYLSVLPSPLAGVVPWDRPASVAAFFALVAVGLAVLVAYNSRRPDVRGSDDDPRPVEEPEL